MKIVIAGAGGMGFHLAKLLCSEQQDIVLIDTNQDVLDYASSHLDIIAIRGDSASLRILNQADTAHTDLFIAVTASEKNNIFSCILAKKLGSKQTIARVYNIEFLTDEQRENFKELGIDAMFSPVQLACKEIYRLIKREVVTDIFDFEGGKLSVIGFKLEKGSAIINRSIRDINLTYEEDFRPIAILRGSHTYLPRQSTILLSNDHVYFITKKEKMEGLIKMVGKQKLKVKNVMIIGGTAMGVRTAEILENEYNVTIIENDKLTCKHLIEKLHNSLVIKGDYSNLDLLKEEGLLEMDAFIALTHNTETNILSSLMAESYGMKKTIALVENVDYTHISQNIGVDTLINKKIIAANYVFRYVRKGKIEAITSLHGVDAELIEFVITKSNKLTKYPIRKLHFPQKAIIGAVIRGEATAFVDGDFQLQVHDKVIVFALPEAIGAVEKLFR